MSSLGLSELLLSLEILSRCRAIYGFRLNFSASIKLVMVINIWFADCIVLKVLSLLLFRKTMRPQPVQTDLKIHLSRWNQWCEWLCWSCARASGKTVKNYSLFKSGYHGISLCNAYQIVVIFITTLYQYMAVPIVRTSHFIIQRRSYSSLQQYHRGNALSKPWICMDLRGSLLCFVTPFFLSTHEQIMTTKADLID